MQTPPNICPQCKAPIPPDAPGGVCPGCALLRVAGPTEPPPGALGNAPDLEEVAAAFPGLEVLELIGHGGMGVVFKARQPRLDRLVALKILPPAFAAQPGFAERFGREARLLARLAHPNIVGVYDFGESGGFFYLLMEFVEGVNLRQAMRAGVTPEQALALVPKICEALQFAHDRGVLHRDIKPENILLDTSGVPKLADFGIAKMAGEVGGATGLTASGAQLGTAAYMAPEQVEKPATVDHRADIYSLGVVFYEMLTGELPIGRFGPPSEKATVSPGVDEVVFRALEKERDRRQQSATEMRTDVEGLSSAGRSGVATRGAEAKADDRWTRLLTALTVLSAVSIPIMGMLGSKMPAPVHGVALTIFFGTLIGVSKMLARRGEPRVAARASTHLRATIGDSAGVPNPWPKRVFLLILGLIVVPALLILVGLVVPMFAYRAAQRPPPAPASMQRLAIVTPERAPFVAKLPQGSIELVSVREHPSTGDLGWQMNGVPAVEGPFVNGGSKAFPDASQWAREFIFRTRDLPADASSPRMVVEGSAGTVGGAGGVESPGVSGEQLSNHHLIVATFPTSVRTTNIRVGVAAGDWHTLHQTASAAGPFATSLAHESAHWELTFGGALETKDERIVVTSTQPDHLDWELRLVAITPDGGAITASRISGANQQREWSFANQTLGSVRGFEFQVRRRHWVEFRGIALERTRATISPRP